MATNTPSPLSQLLSESQASRTDIVHDRGDHTVSQTPGAYAEASRYTRTHTRTHICAHTQIILFGKSEEENTRDLELGVWVLGLKREEDNLRPLGSCRQICGARESSEVSHRVQVSWGESCPSS